MQGFEITAFDTDAGRLRERQSGAFDPAEPGVAEYLVKHSDAMHFTAQLSDLNLCDLVVIALDTATDAAGLVDLSPLQELIEVVLAGVDPRIPVILMSQVPPGFTRRIGQGRDNLFYQVETLVFGDGLMRALEPERFIFGCVKDQSIPRAIQEWHEVGNCPVITMSLESAELAKMSINTFLAAQLITTSTLAELAANVGADWQDIAKTLRMDRRIGPHAYLTPGMGMGGTNIKRDLVGLQKMSEESGVRSQLFADFLDGSDYYLAWMQRVVQALIERMPSLRLGILGLAYKPGTMSTINSAGASLAECFSGRIDVTVHDPHVTWDSSTLNRLKVTEGPNDVLSVSDVVVLACPWADYEPLQDSILNWNGLALLDPNDYLKTLARPEYRSFELHSLGRPISYPTQSKGTST